MPFTFSSKKMYTTSTESDLGFPDHFQILEKSITVNHLHTLHLLLSRGIGNYSKLHIHNCMEADSYYRTDCTSVL